MVRLKDRIKHGYATSWQQNLGEILRDLDSQSHTIHDQKAQEASRGLEQRIFTLSLIDGWLSKPKLASWLPICSAIFSKHSKMVSSLTARALSLRGSHLGTSRFLEQSLNLHFGECLVDLYKDIIICTWRNARNCRYFILHPAKAWNLRNFEIYHLKCQDWSRKVNFKFGRLTLKLEVECEFLMV